MQRFNTVLFDMDGTLLDSLQDLRASVNFALCRQGKPERSLEEIRSFVGNGARMLMTRAFPGGAEAPGFDTAMKDFHEHYAVHCHDLTRPYEHIPELIHALRARGCKLAVVSNKPDTEVKTLAREYFGDMFQAAIGERQGVRRKPAPDPIFQALKDLESDRASALYVGDSDVDLDTARNAGIPCGSVSWGFRSPEQLRQAGAVVLIDDPFQLLDLTGTPA